MLSTGDKLEVLAEIIRVSAKGATQVETSNELAIPAAQVGTYVRFLESRRLLVLVDGVDYFPSEKGLSYLATYDEAADIIDIDGPQSMDRPSRGEIVSWNKEELAARMREIIDR